MIIADWGEFSAEQERLLLDIMRLIERLGLQIAYPSQSIYLATMGNAPDGVEPPAKPNSAPIRNEKGE